MVGRDFFACALPLTDISLTHSLRTAYYVSFGPHGPRKPITSSGQGMRTFAGVAGLIGATFAIFFGLRSTGECFLTPLHTPLAGEIGSQ